MSVRFASGYRFGFPAVFKMVDNHQKRTKITWALVHQIRDEYTGAYGQIRALSKKYGISTAQLQRICQGRSWIDPNYISRYDPRRASRQDWKEIPGFSRYLINSLGEIWSKGVDSPESRTSVPRLLRSSAVCDDSGTVRWIARARLVLLAFVGLPPEKDSQARHLDDNAANDDLSNLAWGSAKDNHADGVRNGKHSKKGTKAAKRYGAHAVGKQRPLEVRLKISETKQKFPERQYYSNPKDPKTGRFL